METCKFWCWLKIILVVSQTNFLKPSSLIPNVKSKIQVNSWWYCIKLLPDFRFYPSNIILKFGSHWLIFRRPIDPASSENDLVNAFPSWAHSGPNTLHLGTLNFTLFKKMCWPTFRIYPCLFGVSMPINKP